ncbi:MAG: type II secretion system F family protein [Levilactobacillus sp.]|jgi:competence protein ComGB|uniref:type II secretion system F family protein n=1 Tax=Levilactobacillus sp. TaxID=2767919 RepID=UPI0025858787|nr:type II secretion system F family protein [Levilactobacillus sp.]MCH4124379.1 type II secretion system F family protein [Levilactobacillus sp.]MCI1554573.1 type II secretion system F family protein [Levilactobacillus sp.]MCI1606440.1 type II secretion system F family protein [Levilactobacillus sp.]
MKQFVPIKSRWQRRNGSSSGRWPLSTQARFCQLLADQLASGFSLQQAVTFLRTVAGRFPADLAAIETGLQNGEPLVELVAPYLQANVCFQLRLTTTYGDLGPALAEAAGFLRLLATQRQKFRQLLAYPVGLFLGMIGLFATLKLGILPQLQQGLAPSAPLSTGWQRYLWGGGVGLGVLGLMLAGKWWRRQPSLRLASLYLQVPVVGPILRAYYGYYLTANLSQLVRSGLSVKQMLAVLRQLPQRALLYQLAGVLTQQLTVGQSPVGWLRQQPFIPGQVVVFLSKGSTPPQLARELHAFSQLQYRELVRRLERALALVQPILLGIVALLIVGAYLSLLLPMYQDLQGVYHD